jgi:hypothetical protein
MTRAESRHGSLCVLSLVGAGLVYPEPRKAPPGVNPGTECAANSRLFGLHDRSSRPNRSNFDSSEAPQ